MAIYLKEIMKRQGIKQKELAEQLGVLPNYIAKLQSGERRLTNDWAIRLAKALNCEPWELCDDSDYFFSRDNLHKIFKNSINFTGDNSNFQNITNHSNAAISQSGNILQGDIYTKDDKAILDLVHQLDIFQKADVILYIKDMIDKKEETSGSE